MEINLPMNASIDDLIKSTKKEFKSKNVLCSINFDVWKYFICQTENNIFAMAYHKDKQVGVYLETFDILSKYYCKCTSSSSGPGKWIICHLPFSMMDPYFYYRSRYAFGESEIEKIECELNNTSNSEIKNYDTSQLLRNDFHQNKAMNKINNNYN